MKKIWIARDKNGLHLFLGQPELTMDGWDLEYLFEDSKLNTWVDLPTELFPQIAFNECAEFNMSAILRPGRIPFRTAISGVI